MKRLLVAAAAAALVAATAAGARPVDTPGVTSTQIVIGGTGPLSGPETAYAPVLRGAQAYFEYVNAHGGVFGRKIVYKIVDDAYDPSKTVLATRQLVDQDRVLAIFNQIGTEHTLAVRDYLNQAKVPQLFAGSGADVIAQQSKKYPWTIGFLPSFSAEGAAYGRYMLKTRPRARVAVLYEDSDYGKELLAGLKRALGKRAGQIVGTQSYEVTDVDVSSQVARLKATNADVFMVFALPKQAIQSVVSASRLGWKPQIYFSGVSIDPAVVKIIRLSGGAAVVDGAISSAYLWDPTNPANAKVPGVKLYKSIMRRYLPSADLGAVAHYYGMAVAFTMVDALRHAGRNLTRDSLLRGATHLREKNPFLYRGVTIATSPRDYFPLGSVTMLRFSKGYWRPFGKLVRLTG